MSALLTLSVLITQAHAASDARAFALVYQAEALLDKQAGQPLTNPQAFDLRTKLLLEALRLEAQSEATSGKPNQQLALSMHARAALANAVDKLESLGVTQSLVAPRSALANGSIVGVVRNASTNLPITVANSIRIQATEFSSQLLPSGAGIINNAPINANGEYSLSLPPGNYQLRTLPGAPNLEFIPQVFGFGNCVDLVQCTRYVGTIVTVADSASATANFSMPTGGRISGNLKRSDTMANLVNTLVSARSESGGFQVNVNTDSSGNFTLQGLAPGRYRVATAGASLPGFLHTVHPNIACGDVDCDTVPGSELITVTGTATTSGINLTVSPGAGELSGIITQAGSNAPVVDAGDGRSVVYLISEDRGTFAQSILSTPTGSYRFAKLRPGNYRVVAVAPGLIGKVVLSTQPSVTTRDCNDPNICDALGIGGAVTIAAGAALSNINFALNAGASVSGSVRTAAGGAPIVGATVTIGNSVYGSSAITDATGNFTVRGLAPGVYYASADALPQNFVQTWLGDIACRGFACINIGRPISLTADASLSDINFNMPVGGTLTGVILDGATGFPAPRQARLELFTANSRTAVVQVFNMGAAGYSATGLPPGAYKAVFASESVLGWVDTAFGGLPCPRGSCDLSLLPTLAVNSGSTTANVGASLPRGPIISGRVTDAATGAPIRALAFGSGLSNFVAFNSNLNNYAGFARVGPSGNFSSRTGLSSGAYFLSSFLLRNNTSFGGGYIDQTYNNIACPFGSCGLTSGAPINVATTSQSGFDIALNQGGAISGTVTRAFNAAPLFGVDVTAYNSAGKVVAAARSNPNGQYRLSGLPAGSYFVSTQNAQGFQDALYSGQSCEPFCNPVSGTPIVVSGTATTSGRDFALQQLVSIGGVVSDGAPADNVAVELYGQIGNLLAQVVSTSTGSYLFDGLTPGRFYVRTRNAQGGVDDLYWQTGNPQNTETSKPACVGTACQVQRGTPIDAQAGSSFNAANLALAAPSSIQGTIKKSPSSAVFSGVALVLYDARGAAVASTSSGADGSYRFSALAAGSYYLVSRGTPGFVDLAYPNSACAAACSGLTGSAIVLAQGASVSAIDLSLSAGASLSGSVVASASNQPIAGIIVQVYNSAGTAVAQLATSATGNYSVNNLVNGQYFVRTQNTPEPGAVSYVNEVHNNRACGAYCDMLNGNPVVITAGNSVTGIDFSLNAGGTISGAISRVAGGSAIALAQVQALDVNGQVAAIASSDASGNFTLSGLPAGSYKIRTSNSAGFINQVYRSTSPLPCSPNPCALSSGTAVSLANAGLVSGINFALSAGGTISGTAADLFNNPLAAGTAVLLGSNAQLLSTAPIASGNFEFNGLAAGSYYLLIRNSSALIDLLYPNIPCPAGACNVQALGTPIVLATNRSTAGLNSTSNIDLRLPVGRAISGQVRAAGLPIADVEVYFFNASGALVGSGISDALGTYQSTETLPAGAGIHYFAATSSPSKRGAGGGLVNRAWSGALCLQACNITEIGTAIPLPQAVGALSGINFDLTQGGSLSGRVSGDNDAELAQVSVEVFNSAGLLSGQTLSDSLGNYQIDGLAPGNYFARTRNVLNLADQVFGSGECTSTCNPLTGSAIAITGTANTGNIDFELTLANAIFRSGFE